MIPKIEQPLFNVKQPSNGKQLKLRPMLVKEEKILLIAKSSEDENDINTAVKQVVNNCVLTEGFSINDITIFDLEYIFIKLRSQSVGNIVDVSYIDNDDDQTRDFKIDLNTLEVTFPENNNKITEGDITIIMKYPPCKLYDDRDLAEKDNIVDGIEHIILNSIDKIYLKDEVYESKTISFEELKEFLDSMPISLYNKCRDYLDDLPFISHEIKYTNNMGNERTITLRNLNDFFTLR